MSCQLTPFVKLSRQINDLRCTMNMPKAIKTSVSLIDYQLDNNFSSTVSTLKEDVFLKQEWLLQRSFEFF